MTSIRSAQEKQSSNTLTNISHRSSANLGATVQSKHSQPTSNSVWFGGRKVRTFGNATKPSATTQTPTSQPTSNSVWSGGRKVQSSGNATAVENVQERLHTGRQGYSYEKTSEIRDGGNFARLSTLVKEGISKDGTSTYYIYEEKSESHSSTEQDKTSVSLDDMIAVFGKNKFF